MQELTLDIILEIFLVVQTNIAAAFAVGTVKGEILSLIRAGFRHEAAEEIRRFWGGMMKYGATTFFEAYGEGKSGKNLLDFYDRPFGLSLCHAWGSAPAFLLPMIFRNKQP